MRVVTCFIKTTKKSVGRPIWLYAKGMTVLLLLAWAEVAAQWGGGGYAYQGRNSVSDGNYGGMAGIAGYTFHKYDFQSGFLWDLSRGRIGGGYVSTARNFYYKTIVFKATGGYKVNTLFPLIREENWLLLVTGSGNHWRLGLGFNHRLYRYSRRGMKLFNLPNNEQSRIEEQRNWMYEITYYLKKNNHKWNAGLSIITYDNFLIQQETNPMFRGQLLYKPTPELLLFSEYWYELAGQFNYRLNYFGYFLKIGALWQLKL